LVAIWIGWLALPRPLYDARMIEDLSRVRTQALQQAVASQPTVALAVLLDALLPLVLDQGLHLAHAVELRRGSLQIANPNEINGVAIPTPFDGMEPLLAALPPSPADRLAWLLSLDAETTQRLLAACTGALINGTHGKFAEPERLKSTDRIARAVGLDMRDHWQGGIEFFDRLSRKALLSALTEARGAQAAENCVKLKKHELAAACNERIPGTGWLPPALLTPEVRAASDEAGEIDGQLDEDVAALDEAA
jgi:ParB family chromosome partitioning protein